MMRKMPKNKPDIATKLRYFARFTRQRGGGYLVEFPDLAGCLTEGETTAVALANAREALSGWLYVAVKRGQEVPKPRVYTGRSYREVAPDFDVMVPLLIIWSRMERRLTQAQMAEALGITQQAYRKLEIPGRSNPTLKTLSRVCRALGLSLELRVA